MAEENNGNGTVAPAFALPGATPWRTITVGDHLKPIVETTVPWDVVSPLYETKHDYRFGRGTWSWILWQDGSINYDDQVRYIDFAFVPKTHKPVHRRQQRFQHQSRPDSYSAIK